ncbi:hypothetical protein DPEC_G00163420 [Dallia pectoralis]|uniref:Uncharacterized protein n=1 Tax=Dallia pectoralis TaxID=75939 RepID=A0ACC2GGX8_DALPE|nr:hypothetical protein DPEC_G00163420 [Dallia pectoralis]
MDSSTLFVDKYLMTVSYQTVVESAGSVMSFARDKAVDVHVTNHLRERLTLDNLESLSFSIPGLHTRLKTTPENVVQFHYGHVLVYSLPPVPADENTHKPEDKEMSLTLSSCAFSSGVASGQTQGLPGDDAPAEIISDSSMKDRSSSSLCQPKDFHLNDPSDSQGSEEQSSCSVSEDYYTCSSAASLDSFSAPWSGRQGPAMGSPAGEPGSPPNLRSAAPTGEDQRCSTERLTVDFKGKSYVRVLSRAKHTADNDCVASWMVTDFTMRGELVFSLQLDFMVPRPNLPRWMEGIEERFC